MGQDPVQRSSVVVIGRRDGHFPPGLEVLSNRVVVHYVDTASELVRVVPSAEAVLLWDVGSPLAMSSSRTHAVRSIGRSRKRL